MLMIGALFMLCALLVAWGQRTQGGSAVVIAGGAVLVYGGSLFIWTLLIMLGFVPVDLLLELWHSYRLDPPWSTLLFFAPPLVPAFVFIWFRGRRSMAGR